LKSNTTIWRRVSLYAPLLIWIGVIFYLSGFGGSFDNTSKFIGPLLRYLFPEAPPETIAAYHFYIRKCAHFTAYAILACLTFRAYVEIEMRAVAALATVLIVAVLDETNQTFTLSRTGAVGDVILDLAGGITAIVVLLMARRSVRPTEQASSNVPPE
jgi:VanZ family protein